MLCLGYFLSAIVGISDFIVTVGSCDLDVGYAVLIESLTVLFIPSSLSSESVGSRSCCSSLAL